MRPEFLADKDVAVLYRSGLFRDMSPPSFLFLGSVLLEMLDSLGRKLRESRSPEENKSQ